MNYKVYGVLFRIAYCLFLAVSIFGFLMIFGGVGKIDYMHEMNEVITSWHLVKAFLISIGGIFVAYFAGKVAFGAEYISKLCFKKYRKQVRSKQIRQFRRFKLRKVS